MQTIGRYEVKGELGRGGMAIVYRAIDPQIGREVAIKVLPREFMQEADFLSRFQREVRTVGQLTHAAIVPLYDAGQDNGQPYLVMRLMSGGSLLDRVRRGALPLNEVVAIITRLGGALDEAHRKGVIHRDLKPGNILLDEVGLPYLSDFGIVKLTDATSMTSRGVIGTPAYMSPEHFEGKVNPRSDVYAMGMILFQLLTGRLPFQAQTPTEWLKVHLMDTPPPLRSINHNLPAALEPILQRALAKSAEARYGSVGELARALSEAVSQSASQPVSRSASQPFGDKPTVLNTPPPMSRPISQSVGQRSASQPASQPLSMPSQSFPWVWLGVGGVIIVMVLLLVITGLIGLVVSRGETAVVVVTATVQPRATFTATPQPTFTWTPTAIAVAKVIPPTDTPVLPTDTPVPPTETASTMTPTNSPTLKSMPMPTATPAPLTYIVVAGDNLRRIASKFGVDIDLLASENGLDKEKSTLQVGDEMIIPFTKTELDAYNKSNHTAVASNTASKPTKTTTIGTVTETAIIATPAILSGRIAYPVFNSDLGSYDIWLADLANNEQVIIANQASQPAFSRNGGLLAYRSWDIRSRGIIYRDFVGGAGGQVTSFVEDALPAWSPDGFSFVFSSRREDDKTSRLLRGDYTRKDSEKGLGFEGSYADILPDGRIIARGCLSGGQDCGLYLLGSTGGSFVKIANDEKNDTAPAASPDGKQLAFMSSGRGGNNWEVWTMNVDGSDPKRLTENSNNDGIPTWSPDSKSIAFASDREGSWAIWVMNANGTNQNKLFDMKGSLNGKVLTDPNNSFGWWEERISWAP